MQEKLPRRLLLSGCILLVVVSITGWVLVPFVVKSTIEGQSVLENGTRLWEQWKDGVTYTFKVYIFNVTNPEEIIAGGEPIVEEIGPYVYKNIYDYQDGYFQDSRKTRYVVFYKVGKADTLFFRNKIITRIIVKESTENDTVIYEDISNFQFNAQLSNGTEEDEITMLNIPFLTVAQRLDTFPFYIRFLAETYLAKFKSEVFVRRTVEEFTFKGRYDRLVYEMEILTRQTYAINSTFGLLRDINGTDNGEFEVYSGKKDPSRVGELISWKGKGELDFWSGPFCNMLNGTDGSVFPPFISKEQQLYIFDKEVCRSVILIYDDEEEIMGIHGYRFRTEKTAMESGKVNPDNLCFCSENDVDNCFLSGVYSVSTCRRDAPTAMSTPHFYDGDPSYSKKFGLRPDSKLHNSYFTIEPNSGTPLQVTKKAQINAAVKTLPSIEKFKKIQTMVFPIVWLDESYNMNEDKVAEIKSRVTTPLKIIEAAKWILISFSLFLIFGSVIIYLLRIRRKQVFV